MQVIYIISDGMQFDTEKDAIEHERTNSVSRSLLSKNLAIHIANKNKLKAKLLPEDVKGVRTAWEDFMKFCPKSASSEITTEFRRAFHDLELWEVSYFIHIKYLKDAKKMIPALNKCLSAHRELEATDEMRRTPTRL